MKTEIRFDSLDQIETPALAVVVFDKEKPFGPRTEKQAALRRHVQSLIDAGEFKGSALETLYYHEPRGLKSRRLLLVGGGKRDRFGAVELRRAAGTAARFLKSKSVTEFAFISDGALDDAELAAGTVEGVIAADFELDKYKTDKKDEKHVESLVIAGLDPGRRSSIEAAARRSQVLAESQNFARNLINEPSNRMTPTILAEAARAMATVKGLECEVLDREAMERMRMGALLAVARGSAEPPAMIVLRYAPPGAPEKPVLGLVGKGVTFDSGGISIKPGEGMEKMKYDMAGGASVLGVMRAIAELKPNLRVVAVVPATENMPGGRAQKPGDIQIAMSGKTIEVLNTDAEGRMILADALHYARTLGCTHLVDAATLTGACVVALGTVNVGGFTNEKSFLDCVLEAAAEEGERIWQLPLDDDYREQIKGQMGDILNTGGRFGGAITAAMFLKEFVNETPWVHLDIAGTAWLDDPKPWMARGASGVVVRTLARLALDMAGK